jgi:hypothetical protein
MLLGMCEKFHALPSEGGILSQPAYIIRMMKIVSMASKEAVDAERS